MKQKPIRQQVMISENMSKWFNILETKYRIKRSNFIRDAIIEKFQRDTPKLRLEEKIRKSDCPF